MSILSEKLRLVREQCGLSQSQVSELSGIGYKTINNYETGASKPDVEKLALLCNIYNVSANYFIETPAVLDNTNITMQDIKVIQKYNKLDEHGKEVTNTIIDLELKRIEKGTIIKKEKIKEQEEVQLKVAASKIQAPKPPIYKPYKEEAPTFNIKYFDDLSVSAGDGNYSTDLAHYVTVKLKNEPPRGTSYIVKVNGHSMEPTLYEGDKIFVKAQPDLEVGDIGIFVVNSSMFIKEYGGKKGLLSHNPACGNIKVNEFNSFWCLGKYLGKCEEEFNE